MSRSWRNWSVVVAVIPNSNEWAFVQLSAICALSRMTSPSLPVNWRPPLPGMLCNGHNETFVPTTVTKGATHKCFHWHNCAAPVPKVSETSANARRRWDSIEPITVVYRWANVIFQVVGGNADVYRLGDLERYADFSRDDLLMFCNIPALLCGASFHRRIDSFDGLAFCGGCFRILCLGFWEDFFTEISNYLMSGFSVNLGGTLAY
jgi:hypothetical protein